MPTAPHFLLATVLTVFALTLGSAPARANLPVYTYALAGLDQDSDESIDIADDELTYLASGAHAELTSPQGGSASATSHFGQNLAYAHSVNPPGGPEQIGALSVWSDLFTVGGGVGTGTAQVSATLSGSFAADYFSAYSYALVKSDQPLLPDAIQAFLQSGVQPVGASLILGAYGDSDTTTGPVGITLGNSFDFTYDSPFFLTSVLVVGASDSGQVDFDGTVAFGITISSGGQLDASSGTAYGAALAVPEPEAWAMMLVGLGLLGLRLRRR